MKEKILSEIKKTLVLQKTTTNILETIDDAMKEFNGKKPSKRIETAVKKVLPEYNVYFNKSYSWYELCISGKELGYGNAINLILGYFSEDIFNYEKYVDLNKRHFLDKMRYENLSNITEKEIDEFINEYENMKSIIKNYSDKLQKMPYPISSLLRIN